MLKQVNPVGERLAVRGMAEILKGLGRMRVERRICRDDAYLACLHDPWLVNCCRLAGGCSASGDSRASYISPVPYGAGLPAVQPG